MKAICMECGNSLEQTTGSNKLGNLCCHQCEYIVQIYSWLQEEPDGNGKQLEVWHKNQVTKISIVGLSEGIRYWML